VELSRYKGKVLLIVNVASQWLDFYIISFRWFIEFFVLFVCVFLPDFDTLAVV
jgi:hypothetical protein